jgi:hypothetical protein
VNASDGVDERHGGDEQHYRKLLAWYPRDHRERHGEEMLGVLLAGAGDGGRRGRKETSDLLRGALRLHLRRVVGADGGIDHRDVFAIVSLLGPIVMLAGSVEMLDRLAGFVQGAGMPSTRTLLFDLPSVPVWTAWFVVAVLSLFRRRRAAAVGAWLGTLAFPLVAARFYPWFIDDDVVVTAGWVVLGLAVAGALTWSPGPARGWELVGRGRVALLVAAVGLSVVLVMKSLNTYNVLYFPVERVTLQFGAVRMGLWVLALAVLVAGALVAAGARTREGRRAALVLCVPVVASVLMLALPIEPDNRAAVAAVLYGVPVVLLVAFGGVPRRMVRA